MAAVRHHGAALIVDEGHPWWSAFKDVDLLVLALRQKRDLCEEALDDMERSGERDYTQQALQHGRLQLAWHNAAIARRLGGDDNSQFMSGYQVATGVAGKVLDLMSRAYLEKGSGGSVTHREVAGLLQFIRSFILG